MAYLRSTSYLRILLCLLLLPVVLCLSVVTVTPEPPVISVRQFEQDYYDAFQTYVTTRTVSDNLKNLNQILKNPNQDISLEELPRASEVNDTINISIDQQIQFD